MLRKLVGGPWYEVQEPLSWKRMTLGSMGSTLTEPAPVPFQPRFERARERASKVSVWMGRSRDQRVNTSMERVGS